MTLDWLKMSVLWPFATSSASSDITKAVLQEVSTPAFNMTWLTKLLPAFSIISAPNGMSLHILQAKALYRSSLDFLLSAKRNMDSRVPVGPVALVWIADCQ